MELFHIEQWNPSKQAIANANAISLTDSVLNMFWNQSDQTMIFGLNSHFTICFNVNLSDTFSKQSIWSNFSQLLRRRLALFRTLPCEQALIQGCQTRSLSFFYNRFHYGFHCGFHYGCHCRFHWKLSDFSVIRQTSLKSLFATEWGFGSSSSTGFSY